MPTSQPEHAIEVRGLRKRFGRVQAVDGMDLTVPRGSVFGFIGPNGAGKTTLIKLLLGIVRPGSGAVRLLGGEPADPAIRRRVGYLPERLQLPAALDARAFLRSVGRLKGLGRAELDAQVPRILDEVGLDPSAWRRRCGTYSKGMVQRTGLAAALLGQPDLLLLDEPTDGIDPLGRRRMRELLSRAASQGATIFLNSHLLAETERLCDHVAIAHRGRIVRDGSLASLRAAGSYQVRFVAAENLELRARAHGFSLEPGDDDNPVFRFDGEDPAALSQALRAALDDDLQLLEVAPRLRDLETVLAETVAAESAQ